MTVLDYCAQPSARRARVDPAPLRTRQVTVDEFNLIAASHDQPVEPLSATYAQIVIGAVRYVVECVEVA